jgi:endoglucanase
MLKVSGNKILDEKNSEVFLRGYNLGTWMLLEPAMLGTPGTETRLRKSMADYAGQDKVDYFFNKFYDAFITEDDIKYISQLGCNSVRIPFNYHHFESDEMPFTYKEDGFKLIDRVVEMCRKYNVYVILDMHTVPGGQNIDWHGDNYAHDSRLYSDPYCVNRFTELWKYIVNHYKDDDIIAGYDLMNEPVAQGKDQVSALNRIYKSVTKEIRKIDKSHIIFLEGNLWGKTFEGFDAPFADNLVYSPHYYATMATQGGEYPVEGEDKASLELQVDIRDEFIKKYNVPCWIGEFGIRYYEPVAARERVLIDQLEIFNSRGYSWCYWTYKDIFLRSVVYFDANSPWVKFMEDFRAIKDKYYADRAVRMANPWDLSEIFKDSEEKDFVIPLAEVKEQIYKDIREAFADLLIPTFAKKFATLSNSDIDELVTSFRFENCTIRKEWEQIFIKYMKH